jgi:hypothetical protein
MSFVYCIFDENSNAVKIGKANNIDERLTDLQTGNSNSLKLIGHVECKSESQSFWLEKKLHKKFKHLLIRGEWFHYDVEIFESFLSNKIDVKVNRKREPIIKNTLFGEEILFGVDNSPSCYFYPNLTAQIMDNFDNALKLKNPYRTMEYPTKGKSMLLPYSNVKDRVFISTKKHQENLELKRFLKIKHQTKHLYDSSKTNLDEFLQ